MAKRRFQPTKSQDGVRRISLPVTYRVTAWEIAAHLVDARFNFSELHVSDDPQKWADALDKVSNTALLNIVKNNIAGDGTETIHYKIGDYDDLRTLVNDLEPYIARRFGYTGDRYGHIHNQQHQED